MISKQLFFKYLSLIIAPNNKQS